MDNTPTTIIMPTVKYVSVLVYLVISIISIGCESTPDISIPKLLDDYGDFGGDFTLTDHHGQSFNLADHRGDIFLIFFGFTYCPDACPTMLVKLQDVYKRLDIPEGHTVRTLYITVDPERDTPEKLNDYLSYFTTIDILGLTGALDEIDTVAKQYSVIYNKVPLESAAGYLVDHSTWLYLVDQNGELRYRFRHADPAQEIMAGVKQLFQTP